MKFTGTAHKYSRDVDTDVIIPAHYLNTSDPAEFAKHCMEDLDAWFVGKVEPGDVLVASRSVRGPDEDAPVRRVHAQHERLALS